VVVVVVSGVVVVISGVVVVISGVAVVSNGIVDIAVVSCGAVVVDNGIIDIVVGGGGCVAGMVVFFGSFGATITRLYTRGRIIAKIVKTIKHMPMILNQRRCHHLRGRLFLVTDSLNTRLLCIVFSTRNLN
jgi:hypothetical protein